MVDKQYFVSFLTSSGKRAGAVEGKREKGEIKEKGEWKRKMKPQASFATLNFVA